MSANPARKVTADDLLQYKPVIERQKDRGTARLKSLKATDLPGVTTNYEQDRTGEEISGLDLAPIIRAIVTYPGFWAAAAHLPDNDIGACPGSPDTGCVVIMPR